MTALALATPRAAQVRFLSTVQAATPAPRSLRPAVAAEAAEIGPLGAIGTPIGFTPGATILIEGDAAAHLFRIESGVVKVFRTLPDGRCQITGFLFPGDFLGLTPEDEYVSGAVACGPVSVSRFPRRQVEQLITVSPLVARLLLRSTCSELIAAQDQMLLLGRKTAVEKLASFLLMIRRRLPGAVQKLPMTRTDIADYLGLTIETVSRTLTQLREDGVIAVNRAELRILDEAQLAERAGLV